MGALATCSALETATDVGTLVVAALEMLCTLDAAMMEALGAHAAAAGAALAMLCALHASDVAGASKDSSTAVAGASEDSSAAAGASEDT